MVKVAIAGGSGEVASEIIAALIAAKKHEITVLTRSVISDGSKQPGLLWRTVDYENPDELAKALRGTHTVLSFIQLLKDTNQEAQRNLIDASILAGVKRFAPSEWGSSSVEDMPWWTGKAVIKRYLEQVNKDKKVIEYTLFQPGLFLDYLAFPYKTSTYVTPLNTMIDIENRRAIVVEGHDATITFTTVHDLAAVVAKAVDHDGEWPTSGGIRGNNIRVSRLIELSENSRGGQFAIEKVTLGDLENGDLKTSWTLGASHPSVSQEQAAQMVKTVLIGTLLSSAKGAWEVPDNFNRIFPNYVFTQMDEFLDKVWKGKP